MPEFTITPWEVSGNIDYNKLIEQFGTDRLTDELLQRIKKQAGELHYLLKRKFFFSHRDLKWVLDEYDKGNPFYLYTGRGPSGHTHLGHLVPWMVTKYLQDAYNVKLWFQMTDDEKFLFKPDLDIEEANEFAYENALDVIALGFDPKKTFIFSDIDYAKTMYKQALKVAKKLTFSTIRSTFGLENDANVGQIFYTAMQSVPAFLESEKKGKNIPCLIPYAIDQDPHFRICRDIMPKLGYHKPAAIHSMFLWGLGEGGKMSASQPETAIFTTDSAEDIKRKISRSYTGGRETEAEQKEKGGNPDICPIFQYWYVFEEDEKKVRKVREECKAGKLMCGHDKKELTEKMIKFLGKHQEKREKAKDKLDKFIVKD